MAPEERTRHEDVERPGRRRLRPAVAGTDFGTRYTCAAPGRGSVRDGPPELPISTWSSASTSSTASTVAAYSSRRLLRGDAGSRIIARGYSVAPSQAAQARS